MKSKGLTIIELLVVIAITTVVASLILADFTQFNTRIGLNIAAQQLMQALRKAQVFASSVRETGGLFPGYGVHIDMANPSRVILFADSDPIGNKVYDAADVAVETIFFEGGNVIDGICVDPPASCAKNSLDTVFLRPEPSVTVTSDGISSYTNAEIHLRGSHPDITKRIRVWITGQISQE